ncbi:MAG: M48 family metallopeptidase [Candidatus Eremiobacteraeota bacterium]|nr:M48 family metallopeptidase [Candidatus Eremiobacteraeota bacterium]
MRRFFIASATGLATGYGLSRTLQAARELRQPRGLFRKDAAAYGRARRCFMVLGMLRSTATLGAFAYGAAERLSGLIPIKAAWLRTICFTSVGLLADGLLELPVYFIEDFTLERRYGLSNQTPGAWLAQQIKGTLISAAFAAPISGLFGLLLRKKPASWPWFASAALSPMLLLANLIVPVFIAPLFNRFEELQGPLEERLRALASRYGVGNADILRMDMSRQTKKANAYVAGVFNTHRIVVGDTLLQSFADDEIGFVVAHELGHYVARDTWRMIAVGQLAGSATMFVADAVMNASREDLWQPQNIARLYFWMTFASQLLRPGLSWFSRSREWAADRFACGATKTPHVGAAAFERLRDVNLAQEEQPRWMELLFSTHPSLKARINALRSASS